MTNKAEFDFKMRGGNHCLVFLGSEHVGDIYSFDDGDSWQYFNGREVETHGTRETGPVFDSLEACKHSLSAE